MTINPTCRGFRNMDKFKSRPRIISLHVPDYGRHIFIYVTTPNFALTQPKDRLESLAWMGFISHLPGKPIEVKGLCTAESWFFVFCCGPSCCHSGQRTPRQY
jgi:hypothetical protein